jgi:xyloglucan-specific exo-beta-1,4-glucanase
MLRLLSRPSLFATGIAIILAAGSYAVTKTVSSQPYVWNHVKILAGGYMPNIVFSPVKKDLVYCRADMGGIYRSEDGGKTWTALLDWSAVPNEQGGESIAADPVNADIFYIAAGMYTRDTTSGNRAIIRTTDGGKTFSVFPIPAVMGGNNNGRCVGERLAIDPNSTNILYFGSRLQGLWTSVDSARTWKRVESFPIKEAAKEAHGWGWRGAGLSFVAFDPSSGTNGKPSKSIYVASTEPEDTHLYHSTDAGKTWQPVPGQPTGFLPVRGQFDASGNLYVVYNSAIGPGEVANGRFWKFNTRDGSWTDISPDPTTGTFHATSDDKIAGGYGGFGLDRRHSGTILIASYNRVVGDDADQLYRTVDGGKTWANITALMHRDMSATPYLPWVGTVDHNIGWWISGLAIDPFDSNHAVYCTGATIYTAGDLTNADKQQPTHWTTCVDGIEETAIRGLISPTEGVHLISVMYDLGGFTHDDLNASPAMQMNPMFTSGDFVDFAELNPKIVVRTGSEAIHFPVDGTMGYSLDGGHQWKPFTPPHFLLQGRSRREGMSVILSADGSTFMILTSPPQISLDQGKTWAVVKGLPDATRPVADRRNPARFYALDMKRLEFWTSRDGGKTFTATPSAGLPPAEDLDAGPVVGYRGDRGGRSTLHTTMGIEGDLWLTCRGGMYHSADGGAHFRQVPGTPEVSCMGFGMAAPGKSYPALYVAGTMGALTAIFKSDDTGATWVRINDDQHQWGTRFEAITGDPRFYGRVYVGTNGRGIVYGDIAQK